MSNILNLGNVGFSSYVEYIIILRATVKTDSYQFLYIDMVHVVGNIYPCFILQLNTSFAMFFIFKSKNWNYCWKACNRRKIKEFGKFSGLAELWSVHTRNLGKNLR